MTTNVRFIAYFSDDTPPRVATGIIEEQELEYLASISDCERNTYVCAIVGYPLEYASKISKIEIEKSNSDE